MKIHIIFLKKNSSLYIFLIGPPNIIDWQSSYSGRIGKSVKFTCKVEGDQPIYVSWENTDRAIQPNYR